MDLVNDFALQDGILDITTNNPVVKTRGDITWTSGCTIDDTTSRTALWWIVGITQNYSDGNQDAQNIGDIKISCSEPPGGTNSNTLFTIDDQIRFHDITFHCEDNTLDASSSDLYCGGDWTMKDPTQTPGVFTCGTSHVYFEGTTTISDMQDQKFWNLTVTGGKSVTVSTKVVITEGIEYMSGCFTDNQPASSDEITIDNYCTVEALAHFYVSSSQTAFVC